MKNEINIELKTSEGGSYEIGIYSSVGQRMKRVKTSEQINKIDIRDLSAGLYYVRIKAGERNQFIKKIIIR